jgi:hypothetical protein
MRTIQYEQRGEKYKQTQTRLIRSLMYNEFGFLIKLDTTNFFVCKLN